MTNIIVVKREWNDSTIKVSIDNNGIYMEASVDAFKSRLGQVLEDNLPGLVPGILVRNAFKTAFESVVREMKVESKKVTEA